MSTQASQSANHGELELPEEVQNSGSWFRSSRIALGLTLTALAQQLGAPIQTVSRWEHGGNRPPWPWMPKLAATFGVPLEEVVERLWGERLGDPCPRHSDCNGIRIRPDDPLALRTLQPSFRRFAERALTLLVKVICANPICGRSHAYPASGKHPKLCPRCSKMLEFDVTGSLKERVERTPCTCQGYHRYGTTVDYGPRCPRVRAFTGGEANEFSSRKKRPLQRWSRYKHLEDGKIQWARTSGQYRVNWEKPFVNLSERTYRCQSCAFASL